MLAVRHSDPTHADIDASAELAKSWIGAVAASQDRQAFDMLYKQYAPKVKRYMMRKGADDAIADDLAQETMVKVWHKAALYDARKAAPSSWIFTIARNLRIDRLRRQKFYEVELTDDHLESGTTAHRPDSMAERLDAGRLAELVSTLPPEQTEVVQLSFFEGLSHSEIGQRLDLPLGTVKSRLRLAFGKLRAAMGEQK